MHPPAGKEGTLEIATIGDYTAPANALAREMERVTKPAGGRFGICVIHTNSGTRVSVNGLDSFPAASTFKIGLAAQVFSLVDQGELELAQMFELLDADRVFYGPIHDHLIHPGVSLSLLNWLELMLKLSDNSATDVLLRVVGGPNVLTGWISQHVGPGFLVAKTTAQETRLAYRLPPNSRWASLSDEVRDRLAIDPSAFDDSRAMSPQERALNSAYLATPTILADILFKVLHGGLLSPSMACLLRAIMQRCEPLTHLAAKLPRDTEVAHKTGLDIGSVNDVGAIRLPGNRGELILAVLNMDQLKSSAISLEAISDVARAAFDYFTLFD